MRGPKELEPLPEEPIMEDRFDVNTPARFKERKQKQEELLAKAPLPTLTRAIVARNTPRRRLRWQIFRVRFVRLIEYNENREIQSPWVVIGSVVITARFKQLCFHALSSLCSCDFALVFGCILVSVIFSFLLTHTKKCFLYVNSIISLSVTLREF
jgi:hypothetical protein